MVDRVATSTDPVERARVFDAFDGFSDPTLKAPLVYGLQDPSPVIRERAADALSGYTSDPLVQQWLQFIAENDDESRVRREAFRALADRNN
jgi:HEAT repeat protein